MRATAVQYLPLKLPVCLALVTACASPILAQEPDATDQRRPSFWQAAAGVAVTNWVTWSYNWYVKRWPWAKVGVNSWENNLRQGFTWDDNSFGVNQLAHPYHGSFYFGSARASGYNFWKSIPFVFAGSASWEIFGENIQPSLNDLISTTLGGMAVGEVSYRLSSFWGSGTKRSSGIGHQLGSFVLNPMARGQTLVRRGSERTVSYGGTPDDRLRVSAGRYQGRTFLELSLRSRSPFDPDVLRPYDAFDLELQVGPAPGVLNRIAISGLLARRPVLETRSDGLVLALFQHYDYEDFGVLKSGGHSFSGALWYRRHLGSRSQLDLGLHAEGVVLGGISSDYGTYWRRDYDLGPGAGARLGTRFVRDGREWLRLDSRVVWLHSLHGSEGDHVATATRLTISVPVKSSFGIGGEFWLLDRRSYYPGSPSVYRRMSQFRAFLAWSPS